MKDPSIMNVIEWSYFSALANVYKQWTYQWLRFSQLDLTNQQCSCCAEGAQMEHCSLLVNSRDGWAVEKLKDDFFPGRHE